MKKEPLIEQFFEWKGLTAVLAVLAILIGAIYAWSRQDARIGAIEKDHMVFADQYKSQINDIKDGQIRLELKIDKIYERFFK